MEADQFHPIPHRLILHAHQDLLEADERFLLWVVDIRLVHFIRHEDQPLVVTQLDDLPHLRLWEAPASGVTRVDDDEGFDPGGGIGVLDGGLEDFEVESPAGGFLELVGDRGAGEGGEGGGVEGVLGDRDPAQSALVLRYV